MGVHTLKENDTRPILTVTLLDTDGTAYDLTSADSVTLNILLVNGTKLSRTMDFNADRTTGIVTYTWEAADWGSAALVPGRHQMEYEVVGPGLINLTFPNGVNDKLHIPGDLD